MDRNEILERLADKVKKEGQVYIPPAISVDTPEYIGSFYSRVKNRQSFAYSIVANGCRVVLEEEPCSHDPRKLIACNLIISKENDAAAGKYYAERMDSGYRTLWHTSAQLQSRNVTDGFKSIDEFLESLC